MPIESEIKSLTANDIREAMLHGDLSGKAFALLSRPQSSLSKEERVKAVGYLSKVALFVRRRDRKYEHLSDSDRQAKSVEGRRSVTEIPRVENPSRRAHSIRSALFFARHYCTALRSRGLLKTPIPATMRKIVHAMQTAIETGVPYHIRMPRGFGKSSIMKCVVMWAVCTGRSKLVEVVAANGRKANGIVRDVWNCMANSPRFIRDFPEVGAFVSLVAKKGVKPDSVMYGGTKVGMAKKADSFTLPTVDVDGERAKCAGATVFSVGFSSNVRGEVVGDQRPDLMIFDDLQDRETANNPETVQEKYELVNGDFMGGDSHTDVSSAFMTSTPIKPEDLSERFAADPYWRTETFKMLDPFPSCFDTRSSDGLWQEFWAIWTHEQKVAGRDPHPAVNAFYSAHRAEMDAGARVLNPMNFRKNEVSAIEHAMILYFRNPKTFAAEYNMEPVRDESLYTIDERLIVSHGRAGSIAGSIPDGTVMICAATDINPSYAFSTVMTAFDGSCTMNYLDAWITPCAIPGDANDSEFTRLVYDGLARVADELVERGFPAKGIEAHWGIDASGNQFRAVTRFAKNFSESHPFDCAALLGRSDKAFNPRVGTRKFSGTPGRNDTVLCWDKATRLEHVFFNKDKFEESTQRAWLSAPGAPGGASLWTNARDGSPANVDAFIIQICAERLLSKTLVAGDKHVYQWREEGKHDLGDACYMTRALAAFHGLVAGETFRRTNDDDGDPDVLFL